jgi:hypothetical protein
MGNRFLGGIAEGAMPWKNRYIGNPVLSWLARTVHNIPIGDFHCGLRSIKKDSYLKLSISGTGMEYASEFIIRAAQAKMKIDEVPTTLSKDGRNRKPHLRPWRDGLRQVFIILKLKFDSKN